MNPHQSRELVVYIAMSLDGYISGMEDDLSFLNRVSVEGEDYGYHAFVDTVDTVVMGRKTYEVVKKLTENFPHSGRKTYVITSDEKGINEPATAVSGDVVSWMIQLKSQPGKYIFCDGGAHTVRTFLQAGLVDRLIISVIPVILSEGTSLFEGLGQSLNLQLESSESFPSGLVQLHYRIQAS